MFSPSGRLSHFSGKKRIEDVFTRYINLSDHDTGGAVQNQEYLIRTLKKLKSESNVALQLFNPGAVNSTVEELQQEISRFHQQLQMAEEQLRIFEPDPLKITSMEDLESCERHLVEALTRVTQRKKCLLSNHLSSYDQSSIQMYLDSQEGLPTSFGNEVASWLPENSHNPIFVGSDSLIPLRDHSSTMYDPISHGTGLNVDPHNMTECHVNDPSNGNLPFWHRAYTSTDLFSALMPSTSFPVIQHGMAGADMPTMMPHEQLETPPSCCANQPRRSQL